MGTSEASDGLDDLSADHGRGLTGRCVGGASVHVVPTGRRVARAEPGEGAIGAAPCGLAARGAVAQAGHVERSSPTADRRPKPAIRGQPLKMA